MRRFVEAFTDPEILRHAVAELERAPDDQPSIGSILCAEKDSLEVEFALKTKGNPIGVARYHLQSTLPSELKGKLPSAQQLANAVRPMLPPGDP